MNAYSRPVIVLGHGVRLAGVDPSPLLNAGVPVLTSWPAADLVDSDHRNYFGRPGAYGQRCANKVLAHADMVLSVGCRLSIWTVGHDFPHPGQQVAMVDCDWREVDKVSAARWIGADIRQFIDSGLLFTAEHGWLRACETWRELYPWLESPTHDHPDGYINPHRFMAMLQPYLRDDEIIVADCATGSLAAHQILRLKPPQRLMTSGGLGEMGCGLPAAIGASFARNKGRVICLNSDGGMMLNLQELQTIVHHQLPIKIVVFSNDGYGMIKDTQRNLGLRQTGVGHASGVTCPDFQSVACAFGIQAFGMLDTDDDSLRRFMECDGPALLDVPVDPDYLWGPKLRPGRNKDGSIKHAKFEEMSP